MKDKRIYIVLLFILSSFIGVAQSRRFQCDSCPTIQDGFTGSFGVSFQRHIDPEVGVIYCVSTLKHSNAVPVVFLPKLSTEFYLAGGEPYLAPKISFEAFYAFAGARINLIDYTNFKISDYRFTPEIGLTLAGVIDIYYGYNIPIGNTRIENVVTNRITVTFNFIPYLNYR